MHRTGWLALAALAIAAPAPAEEPDSITILVPTLEERSSRGDEQWVRKTLEPEGFSFEYRLSPDGYTLFEPKSPEAGIARSFVLMRQSELEELLRTTEAREAPPAITLTVFDNTEGLSLNEWIETSPHAGVVVGIPEKASVDGREALRYTADGLYRADVIVTSGDAGRIVVFHGAYHEVADSRQQDFKYLLTSFSWNARHL